MKQNTKIKLIIVEGRNDLLFLNFLFKNFLQINLEEKQLDEKKSDKNSFYLHHNKNDEDIFIDIFIMQIQGLQSEDVLFENIKLNIQKIIEGKESENQNLTFDLNLIIDADDDLSKRKDQIGNVFTELRKLQNIKIDKTEYFLLPGAKKTGQLEDLIYESLSTLLTHDFNCFDNFKKCMNQDSIKLKHNKNDNFFSKLRLEYYFAFFANKDNDTSCDMAKKLKFIEKKIILTEEDEKKITLKKQNNYKVWQICSKLSEQLSTFIGKTLDVNHPPLEGG